MLTGYWNFVLVHTMSMYPVLRIQTKLLIRLAKSRSGQRSSAPMASSGDITSDSSKGASLPLSTPTSSLDYKSLPIHRLLRSSQLISGQSWGASIRNRGSQPVGPNLMKRLLSTYALLMSRLIKESDHRTVGDRHNFHSGCADQLVTMLV